LAADVEPTPGSEKDRMLYFFTRKFSTEAGRIFECMPQYFGLFGKELIE